MKYAHVSPHRVEIISDKAVFVDGKQYISLRRFMENREEIAHEHKLLAEENERLLQENTYLKELLKTQL